MCRGRGKQWKTTQGETAAPGHRALLSGLGPLAPSLSLLVRPQGAEPGTGRGLWPEHPARSALGQEG